MSIQAVAWALEQDLPARPKLVLVSIANHANHIDGYCWLKAETIAGEAACTPRSIYNFVGALVRNGFIRKALRKGEDGKQRANDYWILFDREDKAWVSAGDPEPPEAEDDPGENASSDEAAQDVVEPHENHSLGETPEPHERDDSRRPVEKHAGSPGPGEAAFTRYESAEPSKSKPKASSAGARVRSAALRRYRPPPPPPLGADTEIKTNPVFVYEHSRAYEAWCKVMARKSGIRSWHLATKKFIDGQWRSGWYFPTLFPQEAKGTSEEKTGPPEPSESELADFK